MQLPAETGGEEWNERELQHKLDDARQLVTAAGEFGIRLQESSERRNGHPPRSNATEGNSNRQFKTDTAKLPRILLVQERTESAAARRFIEMFGQNVRGCDPWGKWLIWDGSRWKIDDSCAIEALAKKTADAIWDEVKDELPQLERPQINALVSFAHDTSKASGINHMLRLARSEPGIPLLPSQLDGDPWLLNVRNGTIDLRTGRIREHVRTDFITKIAPVTFNLDAECPIWLRFTREIMAGKFEDIDFLRRLAGYWLTGSVRDHVLPIFYGVGANGKSVFLNTLLALLGSDYSMKSSSDLLLAKRGDSHPTERADLFGKRLVCCIETESGRRLAESLIKELTGGDSIRARRMREDYWEFQPTHKLAVACNHHPPVRGVDHVIWRRLRLVPFTVTIPDDQQDKSLPVKLQGELSGILNWCLAGCVEWQNVGLQEPESVKVATAGYRAENDVIAQFIEDRCVIGADEKISPNDLFSAFIEWC